MTHGGGNIKLWSCITWSGLGYVVKIDGNMSKELYKSILEDDLMESLNSYGIDLKKTIFQYHNDLKPTAALVQKWLTEQATKHLQLRVVLHSVSHFI